jgi:hypothetical protein
MSHDQHDLKVTYLRTFEVIFVVFRLMNNIIFILHYFGHGYLEEEKSMIHSFTVTFGVKYLTDMVTSVPPSKTFSLIKNNIIHQSKNYKNHFESSDLVNFCPTIFDSSATVYW